MQAAEVPETTQEEQSAEQTEQVDQDGKFTFGKRNFYEKL